MKKIKLFPSSHLEVRIHVSDEMEKDLRACMERERENIFVEKVCDSCSWQGVDFGDAGMCELAEVRRKVLEGENEQN